MPGNDVVEGRGHNGGPCPWPGPARWVMLGPNIAADPRRANTEVE